MQNLPRTPSEIAELHGFEPISVSVGGPSDFAQICRELNTPIRASATLIPGLRSRKIFTYIFATVADPNFFYLASLRVVFTRNRSVVARFPLATAAHGTTDSLPALIGGNRALVRVGCDSATGLSTESIVVIDLLSQTTLCLSPITLPIEADNFAIEEDSIVNCSYRAWCGCLSS